MTYRCPLGALHPTKPDAEAIKRNGWREQGILVIDRKDARLDWVEREMIEQLGDRLYGKTKKGAA